MSGLQAYVPLMPLVGIIRSWWIYLYCYTDRYQEIIETLRYEKPIRVSVYWDDEDHVTSSNLSTYSGEPVGEQEGLGVPT